MNKVSNYIVPLGLFVAVLLVVIASLKYPGGSIHDITTIGYRWTENYISNLLDYNALNGKPNDARPFAVAGAVLMGITMGIAFVRFANKVNIRQYSIVIKWLGIVLIVFSVLITIPAQHDLMVTLGSVSTLFIFFYITILILKSRLVFLKILSVLFLLSFYGAAFMYFTRTGLDYLPTVQKLIHISQIIWVIGLEYFTTKEDFTHISQKA